MILYGVRWPINRPASDPVADAFFEALAQLTREWLDHETPLSLPTSTDPIVAGVMAYTNAHLEHVEVADTRVVRSACRSGRCAASSGRRPG